MSDAKSILILTSCTATKVSLRQAPAEVMYAGQQHQRLMRGISTYRGAGQPAGPLELFIVSAGRGVIAGDRRIRSYDATFSGMRRQQLQRQARKLKVPRAVAELLATPRQLTLLLLGDSYLQAAEISEKTVLGSPTIAFTSPRSARRLPVREGLHVVALDNSQAKRFSCGLVSLKGELVGRMLTTLAESPSAWRPLEASALLNWLDDGVNTSIVDSELLVA